VNRLELKPCAKINIGLNIIEKRTDGYHNLETIFFPLKNLHDELTLEKAQRTSLNCSEKSIETEDNLVLEAIKRLEKFTSQKFNVKMDLIKNIPMGGGLGGGSSDAAAVLLGINKIFELNISEKDLISLALELGSDVPFFINSTPSIGKSRGEILKKIILNLKGFLLIVNPQIHVSTEEAFSNITPMNAKFDYSLLENYSGNLSEFNGLIINDFEENVFNLYPSIGEIKTNMLSNGASFSLMSGTGSTVYGIFDSMDKIERTMKQIPDNYLRIINPL